MKRSRELMCHFVHRVEPKAHRPHMQFLHLHFYRALSMSTLAIRETEKNAPFWVNVPVLSLRRYSIRPSSSGSVLVRTIVPGISLSFMI